MVVETEAPRLLHVFSTFGIGGPQIRFCTMANWFGRRYRHCIVAMDGDFACASRLSDIVLWQALPISIIKGRGPRLRNFARFRRVLSDLRPDLLLTYNWGAIEWALVNRWWPLAPHLHFEDGFGADESPTSQLRRRTYFRRFALSGRTRVVVPSETLRRVATNYWAVPESKLSVIPNGVDCTRFICQREQKKAVRPRCWADGIVIGTVAGLRPVKNLGRLIAAFARLGESFTGTLVLIGDGSERGRLEKLAEASGVGSRIHFLGAIERPEEFLGLFDIFAMSSDSEQMPIALVEAMAAGLPVVATDVGDIASIVAPENRDVIEGCYDDQSLAHGLAALAASPELRAELGARNRARACSEFSLPRMLDRYEKLFETTIVCPRAE
jgi:glycosyltransferase involved in cell wall biosynthesis